jgi:small-conductance mechanosensitive channel
MPGLILAETFWGRHGDAIVGAATTLVITAFVVVLVNRWLSARAIRLAEAMTRREGLSREVDTRLRFTRRVIDVVIVLIGVSIAMSKFTALDQLGRTVLASSAIAAAVIGFAARQALANAIAGIIIAVTQPLRIGDVVTFEGEVGTVEDVKLASTWLRTPADARVVIPNERLAAGILRNDSIITPDVAFEVSLWLTHDMDPVVAVDTLREALDDVIEVRVAETTPEGVRLLLIGPPGPPSTRAAREARLREQGLRAIGRNAPMQTE